MSAVDNLLSRLAALSEAIGALADPTVADNLSVADHLRRGIAVSGLICVETFLKERMREWSSILDAARISAVQLPGGITRYENRVLDVLPKRMRDDDYTIPGARSALIEEIARSLMSLYSGVLIPHQLAFMWAGSNVQSADVEAIVSLVSATEPRKVWGHLTGIWQSFDTFFPGNTSLRNVFEQVADLRHDGAHRENLDVPMPNIKAIPRNVKLVCLCIDLAVSFALRELKVSTPSHPSLSDLRPQARRLVRSKGGWREVPPNRTSATKTYSDLASGIAAACGRRSAESEFVLVLDEVDDILDWRIPA